MFQFFLLDYILISLMEECGCSSFLLDYILISLMGECGCSSFLLDYILLLMVEPFVEFDVQSFRGLITGA